MPDQSGSAEDSLYKFAVDIRQAEIPPLIAVGQSGVIDTQQMQDGGIQVVDMYGVADDVVAKVVGFTPGGTGFDACTCQENGKASGVVVAAVVFV